MVFCSTASVMHFNALLMHFLYFFEKCIPCANCDVLFLQRFIFFTLLYLILILLFLLFLVVNSINFDAQKCILDALMHSHATCILFLKKQSPGASYDHWFFRFSSEFCVWLCSCGFSCCTLCSDGVLSRVVPWSSPHSGGKILFCQNVVFWILSTVVFSLYFSLKNWVSTEFLKFPKLLCAFQWTFRSLRAQLTLVRYTCYLFIHIYEVFDVFVVFLRGWAVKWTALNPHPPAMEMFGCGVLLCKLCSMHSASRVCESPMSANSGPWFSVEPT